MDESKENYYLELTAKYLRNEISQIEKNLLFEWTQENENNKLLFEDARKAWELSGDYAQDFQPDANSAWLKIKPQLKGLKKVPDTYTFIQKTDKNGRVIKGNFWAPYLSLAASLILPLGLIFLFWQLKQDSNTVISFMTNNSEIKNYYLPDSSLIVLNKNTRITYNSNFLYSRELYLDGEAFFDVKKLNGKGFKVITEKTVTQVLGTSFNIKANKSDSLTVIKVFTGKVAFSHKVNENQKVLLVKGMEAVFSGSGEIKKRIGKNENAISWKTQTLAFDDQPIKEVFKELEQYFNVKIQIENSELNSCNFTGTFQNPKIEEVLKIISLSSNSNYKKVRDYYIISGTGCN